ncbi:hypothetical protein [Paraburkholderia caballeronis]|uniref:hypothetical protein n=1 Tax=Paraburkholderia caballeronis TaxID=416943 RepID=UPI0010657049|nr:hypothetical protein [Paraburkholderia caballeronis]TDV06046.1 hypothetical protein C7408_12427 [Paraburkholderia caballeronis]TDV09586.1 hypothetical protein C7406_12627 [Paraburkholderia caballeronis]TDV21651.1 hypothetical protein C7404_12127 [Paraburkholderia caballeronis]
MNLVQLAGMLPRTPEFRAWVEHISVPPQAIGADEAAQFVRAVCKVESRRELARDAAAAHRFETLVRKPFIAWRDRQEMAA